MTREEIIKNIANYEQVIKEAQSNIEECKKMLIALSPIQVGDEVKMTYTDWKKVKTAYEGVCTDIEIQEGWEDYCYRYTAYPKKKDGTISKTGRMAAQNNRKEVKIEKL